MTRVFYVAPDFKDGFLLNGQAPTVTGSAPRFNVNGQIVWATITEAIPTTRRVDASAVTTIYIGTATAGMDENYIHHIVRATFDPLGVLQTKLSAIGTWVNRAQLTYS